MRSSMVLPLSSTFTRKRLISSSNTVSLVMDGFFSRLALSDESRYRFGRHAIFWFAWWVFFGLLYGLPVAAAPMHTIQTPLAFFEALLYMPQHMFLSYGIIYLILPRLLLKGKWWTGILAVIVLILLAAMVSQI